jgi:hypothetical protein
MLRPHLGWAVVLLLTGITLLLGGQTARRVGRISHPDGLFVGGVVVAKGIATARDCDRHGPITGSGFGYIWTCVADVLEEVEPGVTSAWTIQASSATPS